LGLGALALREDGALQFGAEVVRKLVDLILAIDLDGLLGGIADDIAVVAPVKVVLQFGLQLRVEGAVEIIVQLLEEFLALHCFWSPFLVFLK
jgi:hypothetical protein